jgi:UDP-N-acetylenolpyruvoylglucosamine reductase
MNAGGHGSDTAEWLIEAAVLDLATGLVGHEDATGLELSYRHSRLLSNHVVLGAHFRTIPRPKRESDDLMREITAWRKENQPGGTLNAGSVFKNPPGDAAGRIIDELGPQRSQGRRSGNLRSARQLLRGRCQRIVPRMSSISFTGSSRLLPSKPESSSSPR